MARKVVLAGACRTAIGKMGGALSNTPAADLGAIVIKEALRRAGVKPEMVDEVKMGCVIQAAQGQNVARQASIKAGLPIEVPAITINVVCGSGLKCVNDAATMIMAGEADIVVAGGMENMSMAPYAMTKARFGYRMNNATIIDTMVNDALTDAFNHYHMMITAENVCDKYGITREELYLRDYFTGSIEDMCSLWDKIRGFQMESDKLEERILTWSVFVRSHPKWEQEMLESYIRQSGKEHVILAYLTYLAIGYFMDGKPLSDQMFDYLDRAWKQGWELDEICRFAMLKHLSTKPQLSEEEEKEAHTLLLAFTKQGLRFSFYKDLPEHLTPNGMLEALNLLYSREEFLSRMVKTQ